MNGDHKIIRVGSRKSELALVQTRYVISLLKDCFPDREFEIVSMSTLGDKVLDIALPKIGEKSLFTKELEIALATGGVDFVVHSLKDLPTTLPEGMAVGAVLTREDPRDALVLQKDLKDFSLETLPEKSVVGTSSLRRTAQLSKKFPHLIVENIRGNLNTRLKKLDDLGKYQAIILAAAGLKRIGWEDRISKILDEEELLYAVGQGALAIECRADNEEIINMLEPLYDLETTLRVTAERSFLKTLGGGCSAPVAVSSILKITNDNELGLYLKGAVWSLDGKEEAIESSSTNINVKKELRCATCPYKDFKPIEDIESLECGKCIDNGEPISKKIKLDDIPTELLKNDPHEKCPIQLPIGSDFMGKCPYLENKLATSYGLEPTAAEYSKCPFIQGKILNVQEINKLETSNIVEDDNLICGLVTHKKATYNGMVSAKILGEKVANILIKKGALRIMSNAKNIIHSQQKTATVVS